VLGFEWERIWTNDLWFAVPLIVAMSLVYAATRHEDLGAIFRHAVRVARWIVLFLVVLWGLLFLMSWFQ